jgi:hypothetical protein
MLHRFRVATISAADPEALAALYQSVLEYRVRARYSVDGPLARHWGCPAAEGHSCLLLSPDSAQDVFLRVVGSVPSPRYRPLTTFGWNAIEIVVDDLEAAWSAVQATAFEVIGEPRPLGRYPSIRAFQVAGPAREVLYLTSETGDRAASPLPDPGGRIGRVFIMVLAGADIDGLLAAYGAAFGLDAKPVGQRAVGVLQRAQGLAPGDLLPITTARLADHGNLIEFDGYSSRATARDVVPGHLPPGVAMTSIETSDFDAIYGRATEPAGPFEAVNDRPLRHAAPEYAGARAAVMRGPAGELLELIERR